MDGVMDFGGDADQLLALGSAIAVLVGVFLVVEYMVTLIGRATDSYRGRDHCLYCGANLVLGPDQLGYSPRCRSCERNQPWGQGH